MRKRFIRIPTMSNVVDGEGAAPGVEQARRRPHATEAAVTAHLQWAASGAMWLTGRADGPPLLAPAPFASRARDMVAGMAEAAEAAGLAHDGSLEHLDGAALLGERAALAGFERRGTVSAGGSCRLLPCADGWIAVSLARADDVALVPAWLAGFDSGAQTDVAKSASRGRGCRLAHPRGDTDAAAMIARVIRTRRVLEVVERARMLGLPCAESEEMPRAPVEELRSMAYGTPASNDRRAAPGADAARGGGVRSSYSGGARPLVVDLSSLWAGPLAGSLLAAAGMDVVKVESSKRPDGARNGPAAFFDLLNAGKRSVALDFTSTDGRTALGKLLARADVVIEGSRPRALEQLGIDALALLRETPGMVWVSLTGYGRSAPQCQWVAFGDDASAAAGVTAAVATQAGTPVFCGDAIADPLAGMVAASAALHAWSRGGGLLLDVSLRDVTAAVLTSSRLASPPGASDAAVVETGAGQWEVHAGSERQRVERPRARSPKRRASALGADTAAVLVELGISC